MNINPNQLSEKEYNSDKDYLLETDLKSKLSINSERIVNFNNFVGAIKLPTSRKRICKNNKISMNLPAMIDYLFEDEEGMVKKHSYVDSDIEVELKGGINYFPLVAFPFASSVEKLVKVGIRRKTLPKEENLRFIRGKIDFTKNPIVNCTDASKVFCKYGDLTFNTKKNQAILWAIELLLRSKSIFYKTNTKLRGKLIKLKHIFFDAGVILCPMDYKDLENIPFSTANRHYKEPVALAKAVLRKNVFSTLIIHKVKGESISWSMKTGFLSVL